MRVHKCTLIRTDSWMLCGQLGIRETTLKSSYRQYAHRFFSCRSARTSPAACMPDGGSILRLACAQMVVVAHKGTNIDAAKAAVGRAALAGAHVVMLPEMWNTPYDNDNFMPYAEDLTGPPGSAPSIDAIRIAAKLHQVTVVAGSVPERDPSSDKLYNTCVVVGADGNVLGMHRKAHLFDINIPGKVTFRESKTLSAGNSMTVIKVELPTGEIVKIGIGICYDLRFAELAQNMCLRHGATVLLYPGAFNLVTGPAHWSLLQRARALDNQVFVASCSPARSDEGYQAYGHSMVVDPWGSILGDLDEKEGLLVVNLVLSKVTEVRQQIPLTQQRRDALYHS